MSIVVVPLLRASLVVATLALAAACGQKGPLTLPSPAAPASPASAPPAR